MKTKRKKNEKKKRNVKNAKLLILNSKFIEILQRCCKILNYLCNKFFDCDFHNKIKNKIFIFYKNDENATKKNKSKFNS